MSWKVKAVVGLFVVAAMAYAVLAENGDPVEVEIEIEGDDLEP